MTRRGVVGRALATGAGAALTTGWVPVAAAGQEPTPVVSDGESTIETVSGQALYTLPRDHRWHGGPFYETSEYWEWHYWTAFVTDVDSGEEWGLFYTAMLNAFNPSTGEPVVLNYLSATNFATGTFFPSSRFTTEGGQRTGRPAGSTGPDDFEFAISSSDGLSILERYYHADERWAFQVSSAAFGEHVALAMDVEMVLEPPGYLPTTPTGIEEEGYSPDGLYNPETMYGLSYYYYAPSMALNGTITTGEKTHHVSGAAWLEHQWGNYSTADPEAYRWRWGSVRFDDGGGINCGRAVLTTLPSTTSITSRFTGPMEKLPTAMVEILHMKSSTPGSRHRRDINTASTRCCGPPSGSSMFRRSWPSRRS
jgi:hypothetical protein